MKIGLAFTFATVLMMTAPTVAQVADEDFIEDKLFSSTQYYLILEAFFEGMGWPALYDNADGCRNAVSGFFDDFYRLKVNATSSDT
jgi:hypothetical protein